MTGPYTVTFYKNDSDGGGVEEKEEGDNDNPADPNNWGVWAIRTVTPPATNLSGRMPANNPTPPSAYYFDKWSPYHIQDNPYEFTETTSVTADINLFAQYKPILYTLILDLNGGTDEWHPTYGSVSDTHSTSGKTWEEGGWGNATPIEIGYEDTPNNNLTNYTILFNLWSNENDYTSHPARANFTFDNWNTEPDGSGIDVEYSIDMTNEDFADDIIISPDGRSVTLRLFAKWILTKPSH
jgi:hypothetical protein